MGNPRPRSLMGGEIASRLSEFQGMKGKGGSDQKRFLVAKLNGRVQRLRLAAAIRRVGSAARARKMGSSIDGDMPRPSPLCKVRGCVEGEGGGEPIPGDLSFDTGCSPRP